jgi:hypothetical protein
VCRRPRNGVPSPRGLVLRARNGKRHAHEEGAANVGHAAQSTLTTKPMAILAIPATAPSPGSGSIRSDGLLAG